MKRRNQSAGRLFFVKAWLASLAFLMRNVPWFALLLTALISWLALSFASFAPAGEKWAGLNQATWEAVMGSVFAAALFLIIQTVMTRLEKVEPNLKDTYFSEMAITHCVRGAFTQRGSTEVAPVYQELIAKAKHRIWAFGMTNRNFLLQHEAVLLSKIRAQEIDVVIGFWDPNAYLTIDDATRNPRRRSHGLIEIQSRLEHNPTPATEWATEIQKRQSAFLDKIDALNGRAGTLRVFHLAIPTNITCLVVDGDLFFFPFLASGDSTRDPTIHCATDSGLGAKILLHFETLLANDFAAHLVEERPPCAKKSKRK